MVATLGDPLPLAHGRTLPNRIAKSAMSERLAGPDGAPTAAHTTLYRRWALGGTGLLLTGNVMVDGAHIAEPGNVYVPDDPAARDRTLPAWRAWADAAKAGGAVAWVQLNHPGRQTPRTLDPRPVAPSATAVRALGAFARARPLTDAEAEAIIARFAASAAHAVAAGFDGVQVHSAHGYLVSQFLSPRTNQRQDRWGGDLAGRMAFLLAVVRAIRAAVGEGVSVGVKLNTADFQRGGFDIDDALAVACALEAERIDLLELSGGTYERAAMFAESAREVAAPVRASTAAREALFLAQAEQIRARVKLPLLLTGGFRSRAAMSDALSSGAIDVVGLARPLAVEPDLAGRLLSGAADRAAPVRLHTGIASVDAALTGAWFQVQLERLASGAQADPKLGRWPALAWYVRDLLRGTRVPRG